MKNTVTITPEKQKTSPLPRLLTLFTLIAIIVVFITGIGILIGINANRNINNIESVEVNVKSVLSQEDNNQISIITTENTEYIIFSVIGEHLNFYEVKALENNSVKLFVLKNSNKIFGIESSVYNLDTQTALKIASDDIKIGIGLLSGFTILFILLLVFHILKIKKVRNTTEIDVLEKCFNIPFNSPTRNKFVLFGMFPLLAVLVGFIIAVLIEGSKDDTTTKFNILIWTTLAIFVVFAVFCIVGTILIQKKTRKFFDKIYSFNLYEYEDEVENSFLDLQNDILFKFDENGFITDHEKMREIESQMFEDMAQEEAVQNHEVDKEIFKKALANQFDESILKDQNLPDFIPYADLKLYLRVVFRPDGPIMAYIFSNLPQENQFNLKKDIMIELSPDSYYYIKKYHIKVDGLIKFMNNRPKLMKKYCKGKPNIQDLTDSNDNL